MSFRIGKIQIDIDLSLAYFSLEPFQWEILYEDPSQSVESIVQTEWLGISWSVTRYR